MSHDPKAPLLFSGEPGSRSVGKRTVSLPHTTVELLKKRLELYSDGIIHEPLLLGKGRPCANESWVLTSQSRDTVSN